MNRLYRLTIGQRVVAVIALGLTLVSLATVIVNEGWSGGSGQSGFFNNSAAPQIGQATLFAPAGLNGWASLVVWLAAIAIWSSASIVLLSRHADQ
jgi:hypothetical protein